MTSIPLGQAAFKRIDATPIRLRNMIYESLPTNQQDQVSLIGRPALKPFSVAGAGPIRGMFHQAGDLEAEVFVVTGSPPHLWIIDNVGYAADEGPLNHEDAYVSWAADSNSVTFTLGTFGYRYIGGSLQDFVLPDNSYVTSVDYLQGRFLASRAQSQRFYWTEVGTNSPFPALNYASAEDRPDYLNGLRVLNDEIRLFGEKSVETWYSTGDPDLPFQKAAGRTVDIGCAQFATVVRLPDSLVFVGSDQRVYRDTGTLAAISDTSIEQLLQPNPKPLRAWAYSLDGHACYVLTGPTFTVVYDFTTQKWSDYASFGRSYFRGHLGVQLTNDPATTLADGSVLAGDSESGRVWRVDPRLGKDASGADGALEPIVYEFSGALDLTGGVNRCDHVVLDCSQGQAAIDDDPMIEMRVSDDRGETFTDYRATPLGRAGRFRQLVAWKRLGLMRRPGRLFNWRTAPGFRFTVRKASMNEGLR